MRIDFGMTFLISSFACASPTLSPREISVFWKSNGMYELKFPVVHCLETSTSIPCRQWVSFGSERIIAFANPRDDSRAALPGDDVPRIVNRENGKVQIERHFNVDCSRTPPD